MFAVGDPLERPLVRTATADVSIVFVVSVLVWKGPVKEYLVDRCPSVATGWLPRVLLSKPVCSPTLGELSVVSHVRLRVEIVRLTVLLKDCIDC